jgi:hypothetical protein
MISEVEHSPEPDPRAYGKKINTHVLAARGKGPN